MQVAVKQISLAVALEEDDCPHAGEAIGNCDIQHRSGSHFPQGTTRRRSSELTHGRAPSVCPKQEIPLRHG